MAQTATKVLTAHVPLILAAKVDQLAARLDRSRGWVVKQAPSAWVDQEEARIRLTAEAMADVDVGRVVDHQAVQAWADSLGSDQPLERTSKSLSDLGRLYDFLAQVNHRFRQISLAGPRAPERCEKPRSVPHGTGTRGIAPG